MAWHDWDFPKSKPKQAKGGIKAQTQRGSFGTSWWAKRWIQVLEGFHTESRLTRGRSYARRGQVLSGAVEAGSVKGLVQGSRSTPYEVAIAVRTLKPEEWKRVAKVLAAQAAYAASLLAGEMPQDIEAAFEEAGVCLFPESLQEVQTQCSCPDWSNPCKHIAAVYYLLGEEFDRDPFLLFRLRGFEREELMGLLNEGATGRVAELDGAEARRPAESLPVDAEAFWGRVASIAGPPGAAVPHAPGALARQLGHFPFWRGEEPFLAALDHIYATASPRGVSIAAGAPASAGEKRNG